MSGKAGRALSVGANLAVVAGLIFVGLEVRNSRLAAEAQIADGIAEGFIDWNLMSVADPAVTRIWAVGLEAPEYLSDIEAGRFSSYLRALLNQYIRVHRLSETGMVDPDNWAVLASQAAWILSTPGGQLFLEGNELPQGFADALRDVVPTQADQMLGRPLPTDAEW